MGRRNGLRKIRVKNDRSANRGAFGQSAGQLAWNSKRRSFLERFGFFLGKKGRANYSLLWRLVFGKKDSNGKKVVFVR